MRLSLPARLSPAPASGLHWNREWRRSRAWTDALANAAVREHLLFLTATMFVLLICGYHFGTMDQVIHIPSLKKFADPSLYPGDAFMELRLQHYSYFWILLAPLYRLGILEGAMFAIHLLVTYLAFWGLWTLSEILFHNRLTSLIALAALAFPHMTFGGWPVFEFSLLNRTFVFPFLVWAIILYLRRHYLLAFLLLGLMYNLHALSVNFVLAMFLFDSVLQWRRVGWWRPVAGMLLFVIAALPILLWKMSGPGGDLGINSEWYSLIARGMVYSNTYLFGPYAHVLLVTAGGIGSVALFFIARHYAPPREHNKTITNFVSALLLVLAAQVVTSYWLPLTIVVESQIIRAGIFILVLSILYFANFVAESLELRTGSPFDKLLLAGAFIFSILSIVPTGLYALQKLVAAPRWRQVSSSLLVVGASAFLVQFIVGLGIWYPGIYIEGRQTSWYDVQIWARDHAPKAATFITPPYIWWLYESDWRVFSERSTVVSLSELLDVNFAPGYTKTWEERMQAVAPGAVARLNGDNWTNGAVIAQAFYGLSDQEVMRAACRYGATYLVVEKPHLRPFAVVYENQQFIVYGLQPGAEHCSELALH